MYDDVYIEDNGEAESLLFSFVFQQTNTCIYVFFPMEQMNRIKSRSYSWHCSRSNRSRHCSQWAISEPYSRQYVLCFVKKTKKTYKNCQCDCLRHFWRTLVLYVYFWEVYGHDEEGMVSLFSVRVPYFGKKDVFSPKYYASMRARHNFRTLYYTVLSTLAAVAELEIV
jgi:hypothetical protein